MELVSTYIEVAWNPGLRLIRVEITVSAGLYDFG